LSISQEGMEQYLKYKRQEAFEGENGQLAVYSANRNTNNKDREDKLSSLGTNLAKNAPLNDQQIAAIIQAFDKNSKA